MLLLQEWRGGFVVCGEIDHNLDTDKVPYARSATHENAIGLS